MFIINPYIFGGGGEWGSDFDGPLSGDWGVVGSVNTTISNSIASFSTTGVSSIIYLPIDFEDGDFVIAKIRSASTSITGLCLGGSNNQWVSAIFNSSSNFLYKLTSTAGFSTNYGSDPRSEDYTQFYLVKISLVGTNISFETSYDNGVTWDTHDHTAPIADIGGSVINAGLFVYTGGGVMAVDWIRKNYTP